MHHSDWRYALMAFLMALLGIGYSQGKERELQTSATCAEQIQHAQMRRLSMSQVTSRILGKNAITVPEYSGRGSQVTLEVVVGADGTVVCIDNPRGHALMIGPAIKAVSNWRFRPLRDPDSGEPRPFYGDVKARIEKRAKP